MTVWGLSLMRLWFFVTHFRTYFWNETYELNTDGKKSGLLIFRVWSMKGTVFRNILFVHVNASEKCWCGWFIHLWIKYRGFTWLSWVRRANPAFRRPASPTKPKAFGLWTSWPFEVGVSWICLNKSVKIGKNFLVEKPRKIENSVS